MAGLLNINLKINGVDTAVASIEDLEMALSDAKKELKTLQVGSEPFNTLARDIQGAESRLKTINKELEGLEPAQKAEGFVKLGEGIVGAFAVATTALSAFGVESEDVAQAQLKAQQLITVALGARQIAEASLQIKIVATTISQKAQTLATTAQTAAMRALFTVIAANPIGALVTVLAAAAAAAYAFSQSTDDAAQAQKDLNKALTEGQKKAKEQTVTLTTLQTILNDTTATESARKEALEQVQKILPSLNGLELDRADNMDTINTAIQEQIRLIGEQTKAEALRQLIIQKEQELVEKNAESASNYISYWEEFGNYLKNFGNPITAQFDNVLTSVGNKNKALGREQDNLNDLYSQYNTILNNVLTNQGKSNEETRKAAEAAKKEQEAIRKRNEARQAAIKALRDEITSRVTLAEVVKGDLDDPNLIKEIRERINRYQEEINKLYQPESQVVKEYKDLFVTSFDDIANLFKGGTVNFFTDIQGIFQELSQNGYTYLDENGNAVKASFEEVSGVLVGILNEAQNEIAKNLREGVINEEQFGFFQGVIDNYRTLTEEFQKEPRVFGEDTIQKADELEKALFNILGNTQRLYGEFENLGTDIDITSINAQIDDLNDKWEKGYLGKDKAWYDEALSYLTGLRDGLYEIREIPAPDVDLTTALDNLETLREKYIQDFTAILVKRDEYVNGWEKSDEREAAAYKEAETRVDNIINLQRQLIISNQNLIAVRKAAIDTEGEFLVLQEQAQRAFVSNNRQAIFELLAQQEFFVKKERVFGEQRQLEANRLFAVLSNLGIDAAQIEGEERIALLQEYYTFLEERNQTANDNIKKQNQEVYDSLKDNFRQIGETARTGVDVFRQYIEVQIEQLNAEEKIQLDKIVGDNEYANQKRIELAEEYEEKRKALTKKGQIAQLRLTQASALANVADAITKALTAGPVIGQILAGITAGIGLAQVGVIQKQIGNVRALAMGGLLQGPSHASGGIMIGSNVLAEGGEAVINKRTTLEYRTLLSGLNQSGGNGRPLISTPYDDTRLIEALNQSNRNTPLRAYVVERDITTSQEVNKRLNQLSKF